MVCAVVLWLKEAQEEKESKFDGFDHLKLHPIFATTCHHYVFPHFLVEKSRVAYKDDNNFIIIIQ